MTRNIKWLLWTLSMAVAVFATRPAAAFTIHWNQPGWQWFGNDPTSPNPLPDYSPTCMDGSPTGLGIYVPPASAWNKKVMYWFDGGGYCFDNQTCNTNVAPTPSVVLTDAANGTLPPAPFVFRKFFGYPQFLTDINPPPAGTYDLNGMIQTKATLGQGVFDHSTGTANINPFKNYLQVFIPYCTGDLHIGDNYDSQNTAMRVASGAKFYGLMNAYYDVAYTDYYVRQQLATIGGTTPTQVVVAGGSAGGYGALLLYNLLRAALPSTEPMATISDAGTPYYTGLANSNGVGWYSTALQGYMGFPTPEFPASKVTYQEAYMADAWSTTWTEFISASYRDITTPAGSPGPFQSMAYTVYVEMFTNTVGDTFHIIDSNDDYMATWFFNMYPNGASGQTSTVASGQAQLVNTWDFGPNLHQITADESGGGTFAGILPWNMHHGFLLDDVSTWDSTKAQGIQKQNPLLPGHGSGVLQWLNSIAPAGGWL
jgi:hypothetical protein